MRSTLKLMGLSLMISAVTFAAKIAVVDSGVDYKHPELSGKIWDNAGGTVTDADGKKYANVTQGWNFAENNNQVIDYKYLGTFSADCTKIFEVQAKILKEEASEEEKSWYASKKKDETFLKELGKFGNFVHGTHVSGVSAHEAGDAEIVAVKIIPTAPPGSRAQEMLNQFMVGRRAENPLVKMFLGMLAKKQGDMLTGFGKFVAATNSQVANGSFGTSVKAVIPAITPLLTQLLGKEPTEEEKSEYAKYFVEQILVSSKGFVDSSKETLFVFAAGNDGTNNDSLPTSPANLKQDNTIAVAATNGYTALASFSNFGSKMVEVAAPGVAIVAAIPGDATLAMSGTSMAAPFVTNVAGLVKDANEKLESVNIRKVLMETVDKKDFLKGKVTTGGIVNKARALRAADLSRTMSLSEAILAARRDVRDVVEHDSRLTTLENMIVLPLPSPF